MEKMERIRVQERRSHYVAVRFYRVKMHCALQSKGRRIDIRYIATGNIRCCKSESTEYDVDDDQIRGHSQCVNNRLYLV